MPLIDRDSGRQLQPGDEVDLGRRTFRLSAITLSGLAMLLDLEGDGSPFPVKPSAINAYFRPEADSKKLVVSAA